MRRFLVILGFVSIIGTSLEAVEPTTPEKVAAKIHTDVASSLIEGDYKTALEMLRPFVRSAFVEDRKWVFKSSLDLLKLTEFLVQRKTHSEAAKLLMAESLAEFTAQLQAAIPSVPFALTMVESLESNRLRLTAKLDAMDLAGARAVVAELRLRATWIDLSGLIPKNDERKLEAIETAVIALQERLAEANRVPEQITDFREFWAVRVGISALKTVLAQPTQPRRIAAPINQKIHR